MQTSGWVIITNFELFPISLLLLRISLLVSFYYKCSCDGFLESTVVLIILIVLDTYRTESILNICLCLPFKAGTYILALLNK